MIDLIDIMSYYTLAYQKMYEMEEEEDGDVGNIPGMLNRQTSNGMFGVWGHSIDDLLYNGGYKLVKFGDNIICDFDCDS